MEKVPNPWPALRPASIKNLHPCYSSHKLCGPIKVKDMNQISEKPNRWKKTATAPVFVIHATGHKPAQFPSRFTFHVSRLTPHVSSNKVCGPIKVKDMKPSHHWRRGLNPNQKSKIQNENRITQ